MSRRLLGVVVAAAVLILAPLAQATPPDQTWIGGLYDNADYDDVVLMVTGGIPAAATLHFASELSPTNRVVAIVDDLVDMASPAPRLPVPATRAPPQS